MMKKTGALKIHERIFFFFFIGVLHGQNQLIFKRILGRYNMAIYNRGRKRITHNLPIHEVYNSQHLYYKIYIYIYI